MSFLKGDIVVVIDYIRCSDFFNHRSINNTSGICGACNLGKELSYSFRQLMALERLLTYALNHIDDMDKEINKNI